MDTIDFRQEMRIAVVLYGGVSLAIYINGVAQEFLRLVRATAADPNDPTKPRFAPQGTETVYRRLAKIVGDPTRRAGDPEKPRSPVQTRFVIDLISGSSAGGINGIFLSKALAKDCDLDELTKMWIREADIEALINDERSLDSLPRGFELQDPPPSLLNSRRMYYKLWDALRRMDDKEGGSGLVDELDLFVTATDLHGLVVPLQLSDARAYERKHRAVFHFRYASGVFPEDDFTDRSTPFLAFAARSTSAFPVAFEPMKLADVEAILADPNIQSGTKEWERFYREYLRKYEVPSVPFPDRPLADGGYLDNKPFGHVIDLIAQRGADLPVDRKLIYVEPRPESPEKSRPSDRRPDAIQNAWVALSSLPRYETIREDLERVLERNREVERLSAVLASIEQAVQMAEMDQIRTGEQLQVTENYTEAELSPGEWKKMDSADLLRRFGRPYLAYHRLKISAVIDDLTAILTRHFQVDPSSSAARRMRFLVEAWTEREYRENSGSKDKLDRYNQFLLDFDVSYRIRRARRVLREIDRLRRKPPAVLAAPVGEAVVEPELLRAELLRIASRLRLVCRILQRLAPSSADLRTLGDIQGLSNALREVSGEGGPGTSAQLGLELEPPLPRHIELDRARRLLDGGGQAIEQAAQQVRQRYGRAFRSASSVALAVLDSRRASNATARSVRSYLLDIYNNYEKYDSTMFPVLHDSNVFELDPVDVVRISPLDATALVNEPAGDEPKLKGAALGSFGGFLDAQWRQNDIMWGRLDAAERIITAALPDREDKDLREKLIGDTHNIILTEELMAETHVLRVAGGAALTPLRALDIHRETLRPQPDRRLAARSIARSTSVIGKILGSCAEQRRLSGRPGAILARVGQVAAGLVEVAVPRSLASLGFQHLISLALLAEVAAFLLGFLVEGLQRGALILMGWTLVLWLVPLVIRDYLVSSRKVTTMLLWLAGFIIVPLAALGALELANLLGSARTFADIGVPSLRPDRTWFGAITGLAGLLTLLVGGWMQQKLKRLEYRPEMRPKHPMLELEFLRTVGDVEAVAGDQWHMNREVLRAVQEADTWFLAAYGVMFTGLGTVLCLAGLPILGAPAAALGVAAAALDIVENRRINAVLAQSLRELSRGAEIDRQKELPVNIVTPAVRKWACAFGALLAVAAALVLSGGWLLRATGIVAALAGAIGITGLAVKRRRNMLLPIAMTLMVLASSVLTLILLFASRWFFAAFESPTLS